MGCMGLHGGQFSRSLQVLEPFLLHGCGLVLIYSLRMGDTACLNVIQCSIKRSGHCVA